MLNNSPDIIHFPNIVNYSWIYGKNIWNKSVKSFHMNFHKVSIRSFIHSLKMHPIPSSIVLIYFGLYFYLCIGWVNFYFQLSNDRNELLFGSGKWENGNLKDDKNLITNLLFSLTYTYYYGKSSFFIR